MAEECDNNKDQASDEFADQVKCKERRRLKARHQESRDVWFGLGMFGVVGWSVAISTLIGVAVGIWIDNRWPSRYSWTLMCLIVGIAAGCFNAWFWVKRESRRE